MGNALHMSHLFSHTMSSVHKHKQGHTLSLCVHMLRFVPKHVSALKEMGGSLPYSLCTKLCADGGLTSFVAVQPLTICLRHSTNWLVAQLVCALLMTMHIIIITLCSSFAIHIRPLMYWSFKHKHSTPSSSSHPHYIIHEPHDTDHLRWPALHNWQLTLSDDRSILWTMHTGRSSPYPEWGTSCFIIVQEWRMYPWKHLTPSPKCAL